MLDPYVRTRKNPNAGIKGEINLPMTSIDIDARSSEDSFVKIILLLISQSPFSG